MTLLRMKAGGEYDGNLLTFYTECTSTTRVTHGVDGIHEQICALQQISAQATDRSTDIYHERNA
jgi:hypothetical protein